MRGEIDVFYTGGGIWLAEVELKDNKYAVVNSEYPDLFAIYQYAQAEDDKYYPEDMLLDKHKDDLDEEHRKIYEALLSELNNRVK